MSASTVDDAAAGLSSPCPPFPPLDQHEEACDAIESALARHPRWADLRCRAGLLRLARGDVDGAIGDLRVALVTNPRYAWARLNLAAAYALAGESPAAHAALADALDPSPGARTLTACWIAVLEDRPEAAESGLWRLPMRLHDRAEVRFLRAVLLALREGRTPVGAPWAAPSDDGHGRPLLFPGMHELWLILSLHQVRRRRPDLALAAAATASHFWSDPAVVLNHQGRLATLLGDEEHAIRWHTEALDAAPEDPAAAAELARLATRAGDPQKARSLIRTALHRAPGYADLHRHLGSVEATLGNDEDALRSFRRALAINPLYGSARREEAAALARLGRWTEAAAILRRLRPAPPGGGAPARPGSATEEVLRAGSR